MTDNSRILGRVELVSLPEFGLENIPARIDTGARTSSLWASDIKVTDSVLRCVLFGPGSAYFTGQAVSFSTFSDAVVASSNGLEEHRFKVKLLIRIHGVKIRASFTLANRQAQVYPVLVGRNVLLGKFMVDVKQGTPLSLEERRRSRELKTRFNESGE